MKKLFLTKPNQMQLQWNKISLAYIVFIIVMVFTSIFITICCSKFNVKFLMVLISPIIFGVNEYVRKEFNHDYKSVNSLSTIFTSLNYNMIIIKLILHLIFPLLSLHVNNVSFILMNVLPFILTTSVPTDIFGPLMMNPQSSSSSSSSSSGSQLSHISGLTGLTGIFNAISDPSYSTRYPSADGSWNLGGTSHRRASDASLRSLFDEDPAKNPNIIRWLWLDAQSNFQQSRDILSYFSDNGNRLPRLRTITDLKGELMVELEDIIHRQRCGFGLIGNRYMVFPPNYIIGITPPINHLRINEIVNRWHELDQDYRNSFRSLKSEADMATINGNRDPGLKTELYAKFDTTYNSNNTLNVRWEDVWQKGRFHAFRASNENHYDRYSSDNIQNI